MLLKNYIMNIEEIKMSKLDDARKIINEVDQEMARLFEQRMKASEMVALYKKEHAMPIFDGAREDEIIKRNELLIETPIYREYYVNFLKNTIELSKSYQRRLMEGMIVAYSGVEGAFAHMAALKMFPFAKLISYPSFNEAYEAVVKGECDSCVLPVENSYAGDVGIVMDLIFSGSLYINQMIDLEVVQNLIGIKGAKLEDVKEVISHPQALQQSADFIKKYHLVETETTNTAVAAKLVAEKKDQSLCAIASSLTAKLYNLEILVPNVNTSKNNTTRFATFSRSQSMPRATSKMGEHFIIVFTVKNEAGALAQTLNIIGSHGFNMRNLRSRPMKELMWNYYFYVELEGNINTADGKDMLRELESLCDRLKLVGTYEAK